MASMPNPQHEFDFGVDAESAKCFASSDVRDGVSNSATRNGVKGTPPEASGSSAQNCEQCEPPNEPTSTATIPPPQLIAVAQVPQSAKVFARFEELDQEVRVLTLAMAMAQEVIRENHMRLKTLSPEMQSMLSERGELRKQLGKTIGLPSYEDWWKSVQAETRVQLTLRALQYVNRKQNGKPRTPKPTIPPAYLRDDEQHHVLSDTDGIKPGAWKPVAEQMVHLFRESILKVVFGSTDKKATELIHNILTHVFKSTYRPNDN
jgi:hypothetical protein